MTDTTDETDERGEKHAIAGGDDVVDKLRQASKESDADE